MIGVMTVEDDMPAAGQAAQSDRKVVAQRADSRALAQERESISDLLEVAPGTILTPGLNRVSLDIAEVRPSGVRDSQRLHKRAKKSASSSSSLISVKRPAARSASPLARAFFSRCSLSFLTVSYSCIRRRASRTTSLALL